MDATLHDFPFTYWIIRGLVDSKRCAELLDLPAANDPAWIRYDNPAESKWAMEDPQALPEAWRSLFLLLNGPFVVSFLSKLLGVTLQASDTISRGGGLHVMFPGDYLAKHIDYALHPIGLERRANLILFCNTVPDRCGGALSLGDGNQIGLTPIAGDAVFWECGDETYHGVMPLRSGSPCRVTAACYYLAAPRPGCKRTRALFVPSR